MNWIIFEWSYIYDELRRWVMNFFTCGLYEHRYTKTGMLAIAGFCDPYKDPTDEDLKLWMPNATYPPKDLDLIEARFLLAKVADQFCDLFFQEEMAMPENMSSSKCAL